MKRALLVVALFALGAAACQWLLPERFVVNAPMLAMLLGRSVEPPSESVLRERFEVANGYVLGRFAADLPGARFMRVTATGDLLVSRPRAGEIVLLHRDLDADGISDGRTLLLEGLTRPHGMDLHEDWLYVAETDAVGRIRFDASTRSVDGPLERVVTGLPGGGNHWSRTVRFGPDGWMYVSIGSSCNVCEEDDPRRAAIVRYRPDGSEEQLHATGLRNSVGFDWQPGTGALFATDNGRDLLGDDFPPCELNQIVVGGFYGWPYINGAGVPDPDLGSTRDERIARARGPAHGFRAHNAPLGIQFLRHTTHGTYQGDALVALHGSWNRTRKDGYRVVSLHWGADGRIEERAFLTGFERDEDVVGRPVDVVEDASGRIYVSDDYAGTIYRVTRGGPAAGWGAAPAPAGAPAAVDVDAAAIERGQQLWARHDCASCHDPARAEPGMVPRPLEDLAASHDVRSLAALLETPTPPMPLYPLTPAERLDLARFLLQTY
jgi:glucose/arabinose dehydrogenase